MSDWVDRARGAAAAARRYAEAARRVAQARGGGRDAAAERALHGYAWIATLVEAMAAVAHWAETLRGAGGFGEVEALALRVAIAGSAAELVGGVAMSQAETVRPRGLGLAAEASTLAVDTAAAAFLDAPDVRGDLAAAVADGLRPNDGVLDPDLRAIRDTIRDFTDAEIVPNAHRWHLDDALIPDSVIRDMAALGLFGVTIAQERGGLGLGKLAMCVVSEELSRGWICAGSLGTRAEIAGELIADAGTPAQQSFWLPRIAAGETLPTAVFTEPDAGSDLASLATRGRREGDGWRIDGAKTWITHAARADLMTMLVRTGPAAGGHGGLSMLLVPKARGSAAAAFPDEGLSGSEIPVLGYRGMREYALSFDGFRAPTDALLGEVPGQGFRQLMRTFESARIQTAARALGVAQAALAGAIRYAGERRQFGRPIAHVSRVADKIAQVAADVTLARALTHDAARVKDAGGRCDVEAGMAKLLAARTAWSAADQNVQIHGGNGYALEYEASRLLCDARVLSIFEGAAEIQAQVIGRGLLGRDDASTSGG